MALRLLLPLLVLAVVLGLSTSGLGTSPIGSAQADVPPTSVPSAWAYDVKVVMVQGAKPELAEQPPVWSPEGAALPLVDTPWAQLLKTLKARGETTILLDSMVTTVEGMKAEVEQNRARLEDVYDRRDFNNEYRKASTLNEGVKVTVLPTAGRLEYETSVNWLHPGQAKDAMPFQGRWRVRGLWTAVRSGKTLILSHREQVREKGHPPVDLELYTFLTWHQVR